MCDLFSWIECKDGSIWYNTDEDIEREGLDYIDGIGHGAIEKIWKVVGKHCEGILKVPKQLALDVNRGKCAKMAKAAKWAGIHYDAKGCIDSPWWPKDFLKSIKKVKFFQPEKGFKIPDNWKVYDTRNAARDAAWDAARDAAWDAAWNAAGLAARDAAWDAAWDAARNAARNAARDAARNAAGLAARDAAWDAAWDAARNAAWLAAMDAAWLAAMDAALVSRCFISQKKDLIKYSGERWKVWEAGYGLVSDVDGTFYVYKRP